MSLPSDTERDPHADALLTSALSAVASGEAGGCPDAEVIGLYAERAIAGAELRAVEAHVQACPRCQATVAAFVRALPDEAAEAAGAGSGAAETSAGGGFAAWFAGWRWLVPATGLAAVALVAVWVGRGPADQVAESARGPAAVVETDAAAPAAQSAPARQAEAFVPPAPARDAVANRNLERALPPQAPTPQAVARSADMTSARGAGAAGADTRAKAAAPADEARQHAVGQTADRAVANESVGAASPDARAAAASAARESTAAAGAPPPAPAPVQETLAVAPAPAAPAARTATFSALVFSPWRAVDGRVERSRDNGATWQRVPTPDGVRVIAAGSSGGDICWIAAEDGVLRTTDGRTWTRTTRPTSEPLAGIVPVSAQRATVFTTSGARWETSNGGRTWTPAR